MSLDISQKRRKWALFVFFFVFIFNTFFTFNSNYCFANSDRPTVKAGENNAGGTVTGAGDVKDVVADVKSGDNFTNTFKWIFFSITAFFAWMITFAVSLIDFTLKPEFNEILKLKALYAGWSTVRDFFNIFFIFFLLYSAFCTVFQISRYHIKSTWVMIVVMALLVNFSWPVARVIIDVSNVAMYSMVNDDGSSTTKGNALMASIGEGSGFAAAVVGQGKSEKNFNKDTRELTVKMEDASWVNLFMGIVVSFVFMITIMAIAMILVIRTIALAVLLIFASIGFTLAAFPSTRSYASQWWGSLMKYAFIGPILLFIIILSVNVLQEISVNQRYADALKKSAAENTTGSEYMVYALQFIIPIILMWFGIIAAGKIGDGASSMVVGRAKGAAKWGGNKLKSGAFGTGRFVGRAGIGAARTADSLAGANVAKGIGSVRGLKSGIGQRFKNAEDAYNKKITSKKDEVHAATAQMGLGENSSERMKRISNFMGGDANAMTNLNNKKVAEMKKKWKDENTDNATLMNKLTTAKGAEQRALAEFLSSQKDFGKGDDGDYTELMGSLNKLPDQLRNSLEGKMKKEGKAHVVHDQLESEFGASEAHKRTYAKMDAGSWAKNTESLQRAGSAPGSALQRDLRAKLDTAGFANSFQQNTNSADALRMARTINSKHF